MAGALVYRKLGQIHVGFLLALVYLLDGLAYVGFAWVPGYKIGIAVALMCQVASGITMPALVGWALSKFEPNVRGRGMGIWTSCLFLGQFASALIVTAATAATANILTAVAAIGGVSLAASIVAFSAGVRSQRRRPALRP